ncbi:MAG: TlpA family protein disulfide reductase [Deltaproteobacteria bacterium]|nr:TlpA family protein disulfide reductase [Deltaproteobacteria bacterium]
MKTLTIILIALIFCLYAGQAKAIDQLLLKSAGFTALNEAAPEFTVVDAQGRTKSLTDLKGKAVILHLWATWCKDCIKEFPVFDALYRTYKDKKVEFVFVSIDLNSSQQDIDAFAIRHGASFPVYLAEKGRISEAYWTWGVPETYLIDDSGKIAGRAIGPRDWNGQTMRRLLDSMLETKK